MMKSSTLTYLFNSYNIIPENTSGDNLDACFEELIVDINIDSIEPSEMSVKNVLNFARSYDVEESKLTGYIEMILN